MWNVVWPGRFERLEDGKLTDFLSKEDKAKFEIWIDGGHNPQAGESLSRELSKLPLANDIPTIMICGMLLTKDPTGFFENFNSTIEEVYTVPIEQSDAAIEPSKLSDFAQKVGLKSTPSKNVSAALKLIADRYSNSKAVRIIICGSLYLVGQVLEQNETSPK